MKIPTILRTTGFLALLSTTPVLAQEPVEVTEEVIVKEEGVAAEASTKASPLQVGHRLDGTTKLPDIDGKTHTAKDFLGNVTVVNFWSMRCPIMQAYESKYSAIQEDYAKKGVHFLHVNSNEANGEIDDGQPADAKTKPYQKIRDYLAKHKLDRRVLVDHDSVFADALGARTTPDVFVFDKSGRLVYRGLIDTDYDGKQGDKAKHHLRDALDALLAGNYVPLPQTTPHGCSIKRAPKKVQGEAKPAVPASGDKAPVKTTPAKKAPMRKAGGEAPARR